MTWANMAPTVRGRRLDGGPEIRTSPPGGWWLHYMVLSDTIRPALVGTVGDPH